MEAHGLDSMNITQKIKDLIIMGEFLEAKKDLDKISRSTLENLLFIIGCDKGSLCAYSFVCFLLQLHETKELHCFASNLLNIAFCQFEGCLSNFIISYKKSNTALSR